jgi:zinc/manganese transport system substrate-binding protein
MPRSRRASPGVATGRQRAATTACVVMAVALAGCALSAPSGGQGPAALPLRVVRVVAAEDVWGSIAAQLGGTHAHVVSIVSNPATDPHAYEPTAADARQLADAQLAVRNGAGYDPWMTRLLAADGGGRTVLDVGALVGVAPGGNPHFWYSPSDVDQVIGAITTDLIRADPSDRDYFLGRRRQFELVGLAAYHDVITRIRSRFADTPVGASESIVAYLCEAVGLRLVTPASFLRAISEGTDVSAADKVTIDAQIGTRSIAVYLENTQNLTPDVQAQVAAAAVARIPRVRVTETLQPPGATFQAWQTAQLRSLESALESSRA